MGSDVDLALVAKRTPGFVGADLANLVNESALLAVRRGRSAVSMKELDDAIDRVVAGLEKKNRLINPQEKETVAVHETGHALLAAFTPGADPVHKISIIPRGIGALGYTQQLPTEDRYLMTKRELLGKVDVLLGGRAAEQEVFGEISTGAQNDLQRATEIIRSMVLEYGMGESVGTLSFRRRTPSFLGGSMQLGESPPEYSEATAQAVDEEMKRVMSERMRHASEIIRRYRCLLDRVAGVLLEREVIDGEEFRTLIAPELPHDDRDAA
jgi:cell division protease FtsH